MENGFGFSRCVPCSSRERAFLRSRRRCPPRALLATSASLPRTQRLTFFPKDASLPKGLNVSDAAAAYQNWAYPHPLVSGNLLESSSMSETDFRLSGTSTNMGTPSSVFWTTRSLQTTRQCQMAGLRLVQAACEIFSHVMEEDRRGCLSFGQRFAGVRQLAATVEQGIADGLKHFYCA